MKFFGKQRARIRKLEDQVASLMNRVGNLDCEAGRHTWESKNTDSKDPKSPPYLRCAHCWHRPKDNKE